MTNKKKNKAKAMSKKTGMSYAEAINVLNKNQKADGYSDKVDGYADFDTFLNELINNLEPGQFDNLLNNNRLEVLQAMEILLKSIKPKNIPYFAKEDIDNEILVKEVVGLANSNLFQHNNLFIKDVLTLDQIIIEAKALVDRWDCITSLFILNTIHKKYLEKLLNFSNDYMTRMTSSINDKLYLYGAKIEFRDYIDKNTVIAYSSDKYKVSKVQCSHIENLDYNILNKIKYSNINKAVVNNKTLSKILSDDFVFYKNNNTGLIGKVNDVEIYFSDSVKNIEFIDKDNFNLSEFEKSKINNYDIILRINKILNNYDGVCMNINCFNDLLNISGIDYLLSPITKRDILQFGLYGYFKFNGIEKPIYVSKYCNTNEMFGLPEYIVKQLGKIDSQDVLMKVFEVRERELRRFSARFKEMYMNREKEKARSNAANYEKLRDGWSVISDANAGKFIAIKISNGVEERHEFSYPLEFPLTI